MRMSYLNDLRAQGLKIASRSDWGSAYAPSSRVFTRPGRYLFWHISVTNPDSYSSENAHMQAIEKIGKQRFPNTGYPYNVAVFHSSGCKDGQPLDRIGAHTLNNYNISGYPFNLNYFGHAAVLPQNVDDSVTMFQIDQTARWGASLVRSGWSVATNFDNLYLPHRKFTAKSCPGDKAVNLLSELNARFHYYTRYGLGVNMPLDSADKKYLDAKFAALMNLVKTIDDAVWNYPIPSSVGAQGTVRAAKTTLNYAHLDGYRPSPVMQPIYDKLLAQPVADVDEAALAQFLLEKGLGRLSEDEINAIAKAANDELAKRQQG